LGSHKDEDTPRVSQDRSKNTCNAYNAYNAYNNEKRDNHCVRLKPSIHKAVKGYCGISRITIGEFYEKAAILYMDLNPVNWMILNVERPIERASSLDEELQEIICIEKLEKFIEEVAPFKHRLHVNRKEEILKLLKESRKVNKRSPELEALISEVMSYIR